MALLGGLLQQQMDSDIHDPEGDKYGIPGGMNPDGFKSPEAQMAAGAGNIITAVMAETHALEKGIRKLGEGAKRGIEAALALGKKETAALKQVIGAGEKMTRKEVGKAAEVSAAWSLQNKGHEILGSIQNASDQGLDLITAHKGHYYVWEVKGNTAHLRPEQFKGEEYVLTRVRDPFLHPERYDKATQDLARRVWDEPYRIRYNKFQVTFKE
jgi:hypothetical protein